MGSMGPGDNHSNLKKRNGSGNHRSIIQVTNNILQNNPQLAPLSPSQQHQSLTPSKNGKGQGLLSPTGQAGLNRLNIGNNLHGLGNNSKTPKEAMKRLNGIVA